MFTPQVFVPRDWVYAGLLDCCARCKEPDHAVALMEGVSCRLAYLQGGKGKGIVVTRLLVLPHRCDQVQGQTS